MHVPPRSHSSGTPGRSRPGGCQGAGSQFRVLDHGAGVHHHVDAGADGTLSRIVVDDAELKPDSLDSQPVLVENRLIHDRADPAGVDEAVDDRHNSAIRDLGEAWVALLCPYLLRPWVHRDDAMA